MSNEYGVDCMHDCGDDVLGGAVNEMTVRGWQELPWAIFDQTLPVLKLQVIGPLPNDMFDAAYTVLLQFGDLGLYRIGPIIEGLALKQAPPRRALH